MKKLSLGKIFFQCFGFPLSAPFHQRSMRTFVLILLLSERQVGEAQDVSEKPNAVSEAEEGYTGNNFHFLKNGGCFC
jgi:hypothetical protein